MKLPWLNWWQQVVSDLGVRFDRGCEKEATQVTQGKCLGLGRGTWVLNTDFWVTLSPLLLLPHAITPGQWQTLNYSLYLTNGKAEWKRLWGGSPNFKKHQRVAPELSGEPLLTEKLSCGKWGRAFQGQKCLSLRTMVFIWNSMPRIYSLIHLVTLNKIICAISGRDVFPCCDFAYKTHPTPGLSSWT